MFRANKHEKYVAKLFFWFSKKKALVILQGPKIDTQNYDTLISIMHWTIRMEYDAGNKTYILSSPTINATFKKWPACKRLDRSKSLCFQAKPT